MKNEILKIAKVKNIDEFYRKYPSEEAFMKVHGKAFKKAAMGAKMVKKQLTQLTDFSNPPQAQVGIGLNPTGTPLGGSPMGGTDWTMGANIPITGAVGAPTLPGGNAAGMYQVSNFDRQGIQNDIMSTMNKKPGFDLLGKLGGAEGIVGTAGNLIKGFQNLGAEKKARKAAETAANISGITLKAAMSRPKDIAKRQYVRPEDLAISTAEGTPKGLFQGTNTNVLSSAEDGAIIQAQDGMNIINQIGGNPTEIQNMYNPGNIYSDMGYEPLEDSDKVKQYRYGGVRKAQAGMDVFSSIGGQLGTAIGGDNAGSGIGGTLGSTAGTLLGGPIGGAIGNFLGSAIGGALDPNARKIKKANEKTKANMQRAAFASGIQGLQSQYGSYMKDGGWVSHDWQPQVITKFGDMDVSQMHSFATEGMDTLRTGGNITQNNMYPQDQFNFGGQLQTTWGGRAETMSHNPYLPGSGETVMFKGNSHEESDRKGRTGIGVKYGNDGDYSPYIEYGRDGVEDVTDVEVERGEPATELQDSTGDTSMVVFGNLKIPNQFLGEIGDNNAKGKKFKHYAADLSKKEANQNKIIDKASELIDIHDDGTVFGNIALSSAKASLFGANQKLKNIAKFKTNAATVQNAINETAEEHGIDADALAKGKIKIDKEAMKEQAKWGKAIRKAQGGEKIKSVYSLETVPKGQHKSGKYYGKITDTEFEQLKKNNPWYDWSKFNPNKKGDIKDFQKAFNQVATVFGTKTKLTEDDLLGEQTASAKIEYDKDVPATTIPEVKKTEQTTTTPATTNPVQALPTTEKKKKFDWLQGLNTLLPYLQRPYESEMPNLYPEMMALSMNTLEPVKDKGIQPLLETPYDISLQDQINEITAGERAAQRMAMGDPSALGNVAAQSSALKNKVLAEQFRMNQAERAGVYGRNRATLMDTQLKNLGIFADQEQKQRLAERNTKNTAFEAMQSMADKIDRRKSEDRMIRLYGNMYPNYRLTDDQRMVPTGLTLFPGATVASSPTGATPPYVGDKRTSTTDNTTAASAKKGKLVKKNSLNSTVVRALKNI